MSKQIIVKDDLMIRLIASQKNGDRIADFIVNELKSKKDRREILTGQGNYFSCVFVAGSGDRSPKINVGYTTLNKNNAYAKNLLRLNSEAIYTNKQRNTCNLAAFARMFRDFPDSLNKDKIIDEFNEAMKVGSPLKAVISDSIYDFKYAYDQANYCTSRYHDDSNDTLNHSCMRYNNLNEAVASFYCNVCRCKILLVKNILEQVVGRAVIWPNITLGQPDDADRIDNISFCSRMYYTCVGVKDFMLREVKKAGIHMRLGVQSLDCRSEFVLLNEIPGLSRITSVDHNKKFSLSRIYSKLHPTFKHSMGGIPYVDVFSSIVQRNGDLYLVSNPSCEDKMITSVHSTGGTVTISEMLCPVCGQMVPRVNKGLRICPACIKRHETNTVFGAKMNLKVVEVPGYGAIPAICTKRGRLTKNAAYSNMLRQLTTRNN